MEFMLLIHSDETLWSAMPEEETHRIIGAYGAYTHALRESGVYAGGSQLGRSATATSVHVSADGKTTVLDGPYAETKEQLGGYYLIDVPDLDGAIAWASRCPGASYGTIEVRPLVGAPAEV